LKKNGPTTRPRGRLRIIGGRWRTQQIEIPDSEELRPTPDRVRETLFNWLQAYIPGARCLDLFCGSGILGLEALSRGAGHVTFVDHNREQFERIQTLLQRWKNCDARFIQSPVETFLRGPATPFDIVFLDPPYHSHLLDQCCRLLEDNAWLGDPAWIYLETARTDEPPNLPLCWHIHRRGNAGQVAYCLVNRRPVGEN